MERKSRGRVVKLYMLFLISALVFLGNVVTAAAAATEESLPSGITYENIPGEIEGFVGKHKDTMGAMEISIFENEKVIYQNYFGYTDKEEKILADENSVFEWGSVTKLLIWVSVMQLWEEDFIDLEADIKTYLP